MNTLTVNTLRFGELKLTEDQLFSFPMGLLGFAQLKSFVIIDRGEGHPFKWLQSVDDPSIAFVLGDPLGFLPTYRAEIKRADLSTLEPLEESQLILSVIMTITPDPQDISANLCAPLIFNLANRRGMQYVLNDKRYPVKHLLFKEAPVAPPKPRGDQSELRSLALR